jgi:hypothetical protein
LEQNRPELELRSDDRWSFTNRTILTLSCLHPYKGNHFQEQQPGAQQTVAGLFARTKALKNLSPTSLA